MDNVNQWIPQKLLPLNLHQEHQFPQKKTQQRKRINLPQKLPKMERQRNKLSNFLLFYSIFIMASYNILQWNCRGYRTQYEELCLLVQEYLLARKQHRQH
ncbi:hypothetical protein BOW48_12440 [Solemya velum gill symbiont]|nr:hypothetical protein BOW48_12440 [Solemya velum gill symbiont]